MARKRVQDDDEIEDDDAVAAIDDDEDEQPKKKKKKRASRDDDDDGAPKTKSNVFTGLAALTFVALVAVAVFFYLDFEERNVAEKKLTAPTVSVSSLFPTRIAQPPGRL